MDTTIAPAALLHDALARHVASFLARTPLPADLTEAEADSVARAMAMMLPSAVDQLRMPEYEDYVSFVDGRGHTRVGRIFGYDDSHTMAQVVTVHPKGNARNRHQCWDVHHKQLTRVEPSPGQVEGIAAAEESRRAEYVASRARR